jgi:hypothetical protein
MNKDVDMDMDMDTDTDMGIGHWRLDIEHSTLNMGFGHWRLEIEHSTLDIDHWILYTDMDSDIAMKIKHFKI